MSKEEYVLVTTISHFRLRYAIPLSELQKLNPDVEVDPLWANNVVRREKIKEFSQLHISEDIIDNSILSQSELLEKFKEDNPYLSSWSEEKQISWINQWENKE